MRERLVRFGKHIGIAQSVHVAVEHGEQLLNYVAFNL